MVVENAISQPIADARYLKLAGGTMTGNIAMTGVGTLDGVDVSAFKSAYDSHTHDSRYYTESEVDTLLAAQDALSELADVNLAGPADNDLLQYDSGTSKWVDRTLAEAGISGTSHTHGDIYYTETEIDTWRNSTTQTEMGYVAGVTSDIQDQLDGKAATAHAIPGSHTFSGLTIGHVLRASGATAASFAAIQAGDLPTGIDAAKIADGSVTNAEFQQLGTMGAATISGTQWGYLGAMDQGVSIASSPTFAGVAMSGGHLDMGSNSIENATSVTATSFVIGENTLDTNEWAFLDGQDQAVAQASSPTFADVFGPDGFTVGISGNELITFNAAGNIAFSGATLELEATTATTGQITQGGTRFMHSYGTNNLFFGPGAGNFTTTGTGECVGVGADALASLTNGNRNLAFGRQALYSLTSGKYNAAIGSNALRSKTTSGESTALGYSAGWSCNAAGGVYLGRSSGAYETGAHKLFIEDRLRTTEANGRIQSLVYGIFAAATADQYLTINGHLYAREDSLMIGTAKWTFNAATEHINSGAAGYIDVHWADDDKGCRFYSGANLMMTVRRNGAGGGAVKTRLALPASFFIYADATSVAQVTTTQWYCPIDFRQPDNERHYFGTGTDSSVYYDATNLILDPDLVGTGKVYIGATADDDLCAGNICIGGTTVNANFTLVGDAKMGDGGTTNYTEVETDGTIRRVGAATTWEDVYIGFAGAKTPAANIPTWAAFQGNLKQYTFAVNDYLSLSAAEMLHAYKEGSDIELHVHWVTNGLEGADKFVKWEIEYTITNQDPVDGIGDAFPATTTISTETTIPANTPDLTNMYTSVGTISDATLNFGAILVLRVRRIASAGAAPAADPFGLMVGAHVEQDTDGSRTISTK